MTISKAKKLGFFEDRMVFNSHFGFGYTPYFETTDYYYISNPYYLEQDPIKCWDLFGTADSVLFRLYQNENYSSHIKYLTFPVHNIYSDDYSKIEGVFIIDTAGYCISLLNEDGYDKYVTYNDVFQRSIDSTLYNQPFGNILFYLTNKQSFDSKILKDMNLDKEFDVKKYQQICNSFNKD